MDTLDTNVIIESFRTGCWSASCEHYAIETVEKCIEEVMTDDPADLRRYLVERCVRTQRGERRRRPNILKHLKR